MLKLRPTSYEVATDGISCRISLRFEHFPEVLTSENNIQT